MGAARAAENFSAGVRRDFFLFSTGKPEKPLEMGRGL
jgi:hypothetical protein